MRRKININDNWIFTKEDIILSSLPGAGEKVNLPHTWNAKDGQDGGNDYYRGTCTYIKELAKPHLAGNERVFIDIPAAAMSAKVYINGALAAEHAGGYSAFRADITDLLAEENIICIKVDNSANDTVYPQSADFTFYGGLYRGVNLIIVPAEHFELVKDGTCGIKVTPTVDLKTRAATVTIETWQNADEVTITAAGQTQTVKSEGGCAKAVFTIEDAHLWDGIDDPYLYEAKASLESGDEIQTRFGIRSFEITPEGFFLNGRPYPLRGVSRHQDRAGAGNALTPDMHKEDMEIIKEIGANSVRLAHYQHAQEFYDLCDENGIIAWAEIPYITQHMTNGKANAQSQMKELITQCCNHPSIVCWGLSNEITASGTATEELINDHKELNDICRRMDPTRPTTMAHVFMLETDSPLTAVPDCEAYNLYYGWYLGDLEQNEEFFDNYHSDFPDRPIGFSEYGADANPAFHSISPEAGDYSEEYQCVYHEHILKLIEERPWLWCTYVWNMFDFAADGRDEGGKGGVNQKGLVTMDRRIKKDAFYLYKAAWSKESFVHICGRRYADRAEDTTKIKVYSNLPEVTLYKDGKPLGTQEADKIFEFNVPITGEHEITAAASPAKEAACEASPLASPSEGRCLSESEGGGVLYKDTITIKKVASPNPAYIFRKQAVVNWFDKDEFKADHYSIKDKLGVLMANPKTTPIVGKLMEKAMASRGDVAKSASGNENLNKMLGAMSLESLIKRAGDAVPAEAVSALNAALQKIPKE